MWEEILKQKSTKSIFRDKVYQGIKEWVLTKSVGEISARKVIRNKKVIIEQIINNFSAEERPRLRGFTQFAKNKFDGLVTIALRKMEKEGLIETPEKYSAEKIYELIQQPVKIKKAGRRDNYKIFRDALHQAAFRVMEREPSGMKFTVADLIFREEEIVEIAKTSIPTRLSGAFAQFRKNKFKGQMQSAAKKMVSNGLADRTKSSRTSYIMKGWQPGPKPKKLTPEMEEDIEEVVDDNEFTVSDKLSDKIKQILMETPEGKPAKTKEDIKEFNRRFPGLKTNIVIEDDDNDDDIEGMDTGCGCGCDGKEVTKASSKCTKRTKKTSSKVKGKKWTQCVPTAEKGKFRRANWGQAGVKVTGDSGDTERKKTFRARHKCETCKLKNGKKRYYSNQCLACRDW